MKLGASISLEPARAASTVFAVIVACWFASSIAAAAKGAGGPAARWAKVAPLNTPHELCVAAEIGGKVYAVDGIGAALEQFDPAAGSWTTLTNLMMERNFFGFAALNNALFTIGGLSRTNDFHDTVEVYELANRAWRRSVPMPTPRNRLAARRDRRSRAAISKGSPCGMKKPRADTHATQRPDCTQVRWSRRRVAGRLRGVFRQHGRCHHGRGLQPQAGSFSQMHQSVRAFLLRDVWQKRPLRLFDLS